MQRFINYKKRKQVRGSSKNSSVLWNKAPDIKKRIEFLVLSLDIKWVDVDKIVAFRSQNSKARAYARIWGLNKVWQMALNQEPSYVIEVLSERYDNLPQRKQDEILIHELCHIPKNFSGSLLPHTSKRKGNFHDKVHTLVAQYKRIKI